jgi:hypothetical protein
MDSLNNRQLFFVYCVMKNNEENPDSRGGSFGKMTKMIYFVVDLFVSDKK